MRDDLRPLVREAQPLLRELRPPLKRLDARRPSSSGSAKVLNYVANELGYNPPGKEEGYLFWTAWFNHNANSILSVEDAHGVAWRGLVMVGLHEHRPARRRRSLPSPRWSTRPFARHKP